MSASAQSIEQIMWIMRPSKLTAIVLHLLLHGARGPHHSPLISLSLIVQPCHKSAGYSVIAGTSNRSAPWCLGRRTGGNYAEKENNIGVSAVSHLRHGDGSGA